MEPFTARAKTELFTPLASGLKVVPFQEAMRLTPLGAAGGGTIGVAAELGELPTEIKRGAVHR